MYIYIYIYTDNLTGESAVDLAGKAPHATASIGRFSKHRHLVLGSKSKHCSIASVKSGWPVDMQCEARTFILSNQWEYSMKNR